MFQPNAVMSTVNIPLIEIPVMVKYGKGIKGASSVYVWTKEAWEAGYGEAYRLDRKHRVPTALYIRDKNPMANTPMVKQSEAALKNFVIR